MWIDLGDGERPQVWCSEQFAQGEHHDVGRQPLSTPGVLGQRQVVEVDEIDVEVHEQMVEVSHMVAGQARLGDRVESYTLRRGVRDAELGEQVTLTRRQPVLVQAEVPDLLRDEQWGDDARQRARRPEEMR